MALGLNRAAGESLGIACPIARIGASSDAELLDASGRGPLRVRPRSHKGSGICGEGL
jgi:hypothetical protein